MTTANRPWPTTTGTGNALSAGTCWIMTALLLAGTVAVGAVAAVATL